MTYIGKPKRRFRWPNWMQIVIRRLKKNYPRSNYESISIDANDYDSGPIVNSFSISGLISDSWQMFVISAMVLLIFSYPTIAILGSQDGLPGIIAGWLAGICRTTGQCNLYILMPAFAIANMILLDLVLFILFAILGMADKHFDLDGEVHDFANTTDASEAVKELGSQLDVRFEDLRDQIKVDRNEMAWALDAIWNIVNNPQKQDLETMRCYIRKIAGETMSYLEPADIDNCGDDGSGDTVKTGDAVPEKDQVK